MTYETALDIATRFVDQDAETKMYITEEECPIDDDGTLFLQIQNWSDDDGDRTYVDLVSYPGDTVSHSISVEPMDDKEKIAKAIIDICEEV